MTTSRTPAAADQRVAQLVVIQECEAASRCLNSVQLAGGARAKCRLCLYAGNGKLRFWKPVDGREKHPLEVRFREEKRRQARKAAAERRKGKDKKRSLVVRRANREEIRAGAEGGWKSSLNSGRIFHDGDLRTSVGVLQVVLDHKQQPGASWTVKRHEMDKVRADARRLNAIGALVLSNRSGKRVVVLDLDDWKAVERQASLVSRKDVMDAGPLQQ